MWSWNKSSMECGNKAVRRIPAFMCFGEMRRTGGAACVEGGKDFSNVWKKWTKFFQTLEK